jgi:hypothetical protein
MPTIASLIWNKAVVPTTRGPPDALPTKPSHAPAATPSQTTSSATVKRERVSQCGTTAPGPRPRNAASQQFRPVIGKLPTRFGRCEPSGLHRSQKSRRRDWQQHVVSSRASAAPIFSPSRSFATRQVLPCAAAWLILAAVNRACAASTSADACVALVRAPLNASSIRLLWRRFPSACNNPIH